MADVIQLLPESVANQIAAGEVIQRPSSVVKELLENAIDAGSSSIQLIVKNAGKSLIQVIDNGSGMSEMDARMSFERHATSKIKTAQDIFNIGTKGFRGEALASIASIAQVELKTKREEDELGTRIVINGSELKKQEYCETPKGTSISVKNLFFNTPARRKFLKKDATELSHIIEEFKRIALAHPDLRFNLYHNDEEIYHLTPSNLRQRIIGIFGKSYNERIIPLDEDTDVVKISGFIGNQEAAKSSRGEQYIFVNNRFIKSPYLNHAIKNAYTDIIQDDQYPLYIVYLEISPDKIDINIHPTKQEIKFEEEHLIYNFLRVTVKHGLGKYIITPALDFEKEMSFESRQAQGGLHPEQATKGYTLSSKNWESKGDAKWETLYVDMQAEAHGDNALTLPSSIPQGDQNQDWEDQNEKSRVPYQIHNSYILNHIKNGFVIIDQQHAHERILFERYLARARQNKPEVQSLLFPISLELKKEDEVLLNEILLEVNKLGFDIEGFGGYSIIIRGIPAGLEENDCGELLQKILEQYRGNLNLELGVEENLARSLAKNAAIKKPKRLKLDEMQELINQLFACESPSHSPSGRKCYVSYDLESLEKSFK